MMNITTHWKFGQDYINPAFDYLNTGNYNINPGIVDVVFISKNDSKKFASKIKNALNIVKRNGFIKDNDTDYCVNEFIERFNLKYRSGDYKTSNKGFNAIRIPNARMIVITDYGTPPYAFIQVRTNFGKYDYTLETIAIQNTIVNRFIIILVL